MKIPSPFNAIEYGKVVEEISSIDIIAGYKNTYAIDVSENLKGIPIVYLCECSVTKLHYYYPFNLDGDSVFYQALSQKDWYYHKERWEHKAALNFIKENNTVLEIGSGSGSFLKQLTKHINVKYCGLELNPKAIELAAEDSITLTNELLNSHVISNNLKYDIVCSFQVYEHISKIDEVFSDSIKVLKQNGLLIVSVPNNDVGFIKNNKSSSKYLNMPPHHVNLFTKESLINIGNFYNLKTIQIIEEPIQNMHVDVYLYEKISRFFIGSSFLLRAFWKLKLHVPLRFLVRLFRNNIKGHSIIAVFKKQ